MSFESESTTEFGRKLTEDPALKQRLDALVLELRKAAEKELGEELHYDFTTADMLNIRYTRIG